MARSYTPNAGFSKYAFGDSKFSGADWSEGLNANWDQLDGMAGNGLSWDSSTPKKLQVNTDNTTTTISGDNVVVKDPLTIGSIIFTPKTAAPGSPTQGQVCLADRTNWDPLGKGSGGPYFVWYNGSAWVAIDSQ
jgi:hypothetical protein